MRRPAGQDGFVMVVVMFVLVIALAFTGVAMDDVVFNRSRANVDRKVMRAQQAADAGLQETLYKLNQTSHSLNNYNGTLSKISTGLACMAYIKVNGTVYSDKIDVLYAQAGAETTCANGQPVPTYGAAPTQNQLGNRQWYEAIWVPGETAVGSHVKLDNPRIVVAGYDDAGTTNTTYDDKVRRVVGVLNDIDPFEAVEATGDLTFRGLATTFNGNARANDDLDVAGLAITGGNILSGGSLINTSSFQYGGLKTGGVMLPAPEDIYPGQADPPSPFFERPNISISPSKPDCGGAAPSGPCPNALYYNASTKRLDIPKGVTVTLASGDYVFCDVTVAEDDALNLFDSPGTLRTATTGDPVRIYIDSPNSARCSNSSHNGSFDIRGRLNPGLSLAPNQLQLYVVGRGTSNPVSSFIGASRIPLSSAFFYYGPESNITVHYSVFEGTIIGRDVVMYADQLGLSLVGVITQDLDLVDIPLNNSLAVHNVEHYIECEPRRLSDRNGDGKVLLNDGILDNC